MKYEKFFEEQIDIAGDDHLSSSPDTPLREDAFEISDEEKISIIEKKRLQYFRDNWYGPYRRQFERHTKKSR